MPTSRKKALQLMHKGIVTYKLIKEGWDVSDHLGDGYDLLAEKANKFIKVELKGIDLDAIQAGARATQRLSANEIVRATHLIVSVFKSIELHGHYIMSIKQFITNSGVEKYETYGQEKGYDFFLKEYERLAQQQAERRRNAGEERLNLHFDFGFNPNNIEKWKFASYKDGWKNLI